jgi:hypothetical protein
MKRRAGWITLSASALLFSCLSVQPAEAQSCPRGQRLHKLFASIWIKDLALGGLNVTKILEECAKDKYGVTNLRIKTECQLYKAGRAYGPPTTYDVCPADSPDTEGPGSSWCTGMVTVTVCK